MRAIPPPCGQAVVADLARLAALVSGARCYASGHMQEVALAQAGARVRWRGFTDRLQTPRDLLGKMERDLERMRADPGNPDPAFDFFVAAEHIVDWRYPSDSDRDKAARKEVRAHEPGATVSHLASGAKHFEARAPQHQSVTSVERDPGSDWDEARWDESRWGGRPALIVTMTDGRLVDAIQLADLIVAYWQKEFGPGRMHDLGEDVDP